MKNIVLFGPPGSGKGTQASNIISKYNLIHLSTGDMLRAEIAAQTTLGLEAKALMDKGELVPDAVVIGMIEHKLDANPYAAGFVFDGFPRTVGQAEALDTLLDTRGIPIQKVLSLKVSEEELTKRILDRGKTSGRADDQNPEIVKNRVIEYRTKTEPLAHYYSAEGKLVEIQGEGTVEHISDMLFHEIDSILDHELALPAAKEEKALPAPAKKVVAKTPAAKKASPKAPTKKAVKKVAPKKAAKKAAPKKAVKKAPAKKAAPVKKAPAKKVVKKAAPKKAVKKAPAKKVAPKKIVKKAAPKKAVKKVAPKKKIAAKKVIKKAAPKKAMKKVAAKKKVIAKKIVKKAAPKKAVKKAAIKKKAVVKKAAPKKAVKKAPAKKKGKK
jgi:adenylate kinase